MTKAEKKKIEKFLSLVNQIGEDNISNDKKHELFAKIIHYGIQRNGYDELSSLFSQSKITLNRWKDGLNAPPFPLMQNIVEYFRQELNNALLNAKKDDF